jgi:membrane-bound metal-dependent hydrolase YbcI (DUF457 family)
VLSGHLAVAALLRHYLQTEPLSTLGGSAAPDLLDKALYQGGVTKSSRTYGHTLLGAAVSTALVYLIWGKRPAQSWFVGYLGHLLADAGGFVPWFYPWKRYTFYPKLCEPLSPLQFVRMSPLELPLLLWAAYIKCRRPTFHVGGARLQRPSLLDIIGNNIMSNNRTAD